MINEMRNKEREKRKKPVAEYSFCECNKCRGLGEIQEYDEKCDFLIRVTRCNKCDGNGLIQYQTLNPYPKMIIAKSKLRYIR